MQRFIRLKSHQDLLNSLSDAIALVQYVSTERGVWRNVGREKKSCAIVRWVLHVCKNNKYSFGFLNHPGPKNTTLKRPGACRGFSRAGQCVYSCDYNDFSTVSNDQKPEQHQGCNQPRGRAEVAAYRALQNHPTSHVMEQRPSNHSTLTPSLTSLHQPPPVTG